MAIDFPAGNAGNSPFDAPNGVTYTWNDDGYWEAQIDSSGGGDGSVGSLQEVTDVGNSTTNDVLAQDFFSRTDSLPSTTNPGFYVGGGNGIYISSDSTSGSATLWQGFSTDAGDQTSRINVDGGASFASGDITLNADGSAEFAGGAVDINTNGAIKVSRSGATDNCFIAALNDTERAIIEADGSAEFAGNIQVGGEPNDGTNAGAKIIPQGMVMAARATGSSASAVWSGFLEGTTPPTSRINADGSSLFSGKMEINMGDNPVLDLYRATTSVGGGVLRIYSDVGDTKRRSFAITADGSTSIGGVDNSGAPNIALNADGSGTFAGSIQSGGAAYDGSLGFRTSAFGTVYVCSVETTGVGSNGAIWQGYTEGSGTSTSTIFSDGSAVFSEQVNSGEPETGKWRTDANWGFTAAFENNGNGFAGYWNNTHTSPSSPYLLRGVVNGTDTVQIKSDGSASFAGNITSNDDPSGGINVGAVLYGDQGTVAACADGDVSVWSAWSKGTTAATSTIHADGSASFAGTISHQNESVFFNTDTPGVIIGETAIHGFSAGVYGFTKAGWLFTHTPQRSVSWNIFDQKLLSSSTDPDSITDWISKIKLASDGSATFMGPFDMKADDFSVIINGAGVNVKVPNDADATETAFNVLRSSNDGSDASTIAKITGDGGATFAGNVKTGNGLVTTGDSGAQINSNGQISSSRVVETGSQATTDAFYVQVANDSSTAKTKVIDFKCDGSANFAGAVTAATVNGVNVANVGEALTALKTAAAASTNHDELKAAIASALANF